MASIAAVIFIADTALDRCHETEPNHWSAGFRTATVTQGKQALAELPWCHLTGGT